MDRRDAFEKSWAERHRISVEEIRGHRFETEDGYELPSLAAHYRTWCSSHPVWQPIDTCPLYEEVLFYREDCGVLLGRRCDRDTLMDDKERDEWEGTEDQLYDIEYWCFGQWGVELLDGLEVPTHWMPFPEGPEVAT